MERSAAIAAEFSSGVGCPQPVAASRTFRINALHSPSRQILHSFPPLESHAIFAFTVNVPGKPLTLNRFGPPRTGKLTEKLRGFCDGGLVVSREKIQFLVVGLPTHSRARGRYNRQERIRAAKIRLPPLQPFRACPQSVLPVRGKMRKRTERLVCGNGCGTR